jgi:hypothetical protein
MMQADKDAIISMRVMPQLKAEMQRLANIAGVSLSEFGRLLWERDIYRASESAESAATFATRIAAGHYGSPADAVEYAAQARERLAMIHGDIGRDLGVRA